MVLLWYEYALIAAIFATTLTLTVVIAFLLSRVRVQKWIGGAIGNFMTNRSRAADKEGVEGGGASGVLNLGGFKIDVGMVKEIAPLVMEYGPKILKMAKQFGLVKGEGMGGGGFGP